MIRTAFKVFFKVLLALGAVFGALALLQYIDNNQSDYIEIYNDDGLDGDYF